MPTSLPYEGTSEVQLIAEGNEKAFFEFYNHHAGLLRPFLVRYTRSETDVEDIIQETFIKIWLHRDQLPQIENLRAWIVRIATRVYLDHVDRELRSRNRKESFSRDWYGAGEVVSEERTRLLEIRKNILHALDGLSELRKKIFRLNRELGMKPAQIAELLDMPVGTVKNQLSAALRQVRDQLAASGYGPLIALWLISRFF
ncbi:RNA polymerase sigma factor [Chitinophaga sp. GCM10012297]|uniref:RNA polymerase sigma factor n=1 Tax=Chitinophaga chungangae TaxID=2821488 RepID=A0ABS3YKI1_9BACT|nr:RNA polymerase sigma factor [Chitinophaga chungangae]MBO9155190.1 RNA polymerase sigma factor [Chitinophaga chungangae]